MTSTVGSGLAKVTVSTPKRRIDVALPEDVAVAELLPELLQHAGDGLADDGERHGGWVLRRSTGTLLEPDRNLAGQGVRDGEVLNLVPRRAEWPELEYDDVIEAIAGGARRHGRSWGGKATRYGALAAGAGTLVLGLVGVLLAGPPWLVPGLVALGVAFLLAIIGTVLARAIGDGVAGATVAAAGLPYAFAGGALVVAPASTRLVDIGAPHVLLGSMLLALFGVIGYIGVGVATRLFAGAVAAGVLGMIGAAFGLTSMPADAAPAIALTLGIALMPAYPLLSMRIGRLPLPVLPQRAEDMLKDDPVPQRSEVFAAVARSDEVLTGLLMAVSVVTAASGVLLIVTGRSGAVALAVLGACALLLRGRLFPTPRQRIPMLLGGAGILVVLFVGLAFSLSADAELPVTLLISLVGGAAVLTAGLLYSHRPPSPYIGRLADILDVLLLCSLIPVACLSLGAYRYVQGLFASFGG